MKLELNIKQQLSQEEINKLQEIVQAIVFSGGHSGVKGGKTILHFDAQGLFQGVQLDYWPWRKRKSDV